MSRRRTLDGIGMDPFWLTFRGKQLERLWQASQKLRRRNGDEGFFLVFALLVGVGALRALRVKTKLFDKLLLPAIVSEFFLMLQLIRRKPELYSQHRDAIVALQRTLHFLAMCHLIMVEQEPVDSWLHFVLYDLAHYGKSMFMVVNGLLLPLNFRDHLFVHSFQLIIAMYYNPAMCHAFIQRMPSNVEKYEKINQYLNVLFCPIWKSHCDQLGSENYSRKEGPCVRAQSFLQIMSGFVLTSAFLYFVERHSRSVFRARQLRRHPPQISQQWPAYLLSLVLMYFGLAFLWQWHSWLLSNRF